MALLLIKRVHVATYVSAFKKFGCLLSTAIDETDVSVIRMLFPSFERDTSLPTPGPSHLSIVADLMKLGAKACSGQVLWIEPLLSRLILITFPHWHARMCTTRVWLKA